VGGTGLNKNANNDKNDILNLQKVEKTVENSIKIIQSIKIW